VSTLHMLDTDTVSYLLKGQATNIETQLRLMPPTQICISVVTRAELLYGLARLVPQHRLQLVVRQFLKVARCLPWDADAADWYAQIRHQLMRSSQPIGEMDMMIAAHALSRGAVLVSNNSRHFKQIEAPLMLVNWV